MALPHTPFVRTPDEPNASSKIDRHKAMVRYIDKLVGKLVQALGDLGIRDNTILIFTTDNGSTGSITGTLNGTKVQGGKSKEKESGICAPFIVNCPGLVAAGKETNALTDFSDLLPTFVELGGGKVPDNLVVDGQSIAPLILGKEKDSKRKWIMALGFGKGKLDKKGVRGRDDFISRVIRDKRFKVWVSNKKEIVRLHDLTEDPSEKTNLFQSKKPGHKKAIHKFEKVLASLPNKDARPLYTPRAKNPWDLKK
jgi:arylsulfatase A-like enzyme